MPKKNPSSVPAGSKKRKGSGLLGRLVRRFLLVVLTVAVMAGVALGVLLNQVFHGPSVAARDAFTMTLLESHHTEWIPGIFLDDETIDRIRSADRNGLPSQVSDPARIAVGGASAGGTNWGEYPDGIRVDTVQAAHYTAHVMIVRDPSSVYLSCANGGHFSLNRPGASVADQVRTEDAIAGINAGTVYYDPATRQENKNMPSGMVISGSEVVWSTGTPRNGASGFVGFSEDDILIVAETMTQELARELDIRDGCQFGPVLIMDGKANTGIYNASSGYNARTCIGQRADGTVVFLCIDGPREDSYGGTIQDCIDLLLEYGCVNACNLEGGVYSTMVYGEQTVNAPSLLQEEPQPMPTFWMVRPSEER